MVGEWGTLFPVLRPKRLKSPQGPLKHVPHGPPGVGPARLFATAIEGLILPEPSEPTPETGARVIEAGRWLRVV
jgi:hypothetical protein